MNLRESAPHQNSSRETLTAMLMQEQNFLQTKKAFDDLQRSASQKAYEEIPSQGKRRTRNSLEGGTQMDAARAAKRQAEEELTALATSLYESLLNKSEKLPVPTGMYRAEIIFPCRGNDLKSVRTPTFEITVGKTAADLIRASLKAVAELRLFRLGLDVGELGLAPVEIKAIKDDPSTAFKSPAWNFWLDINGEPISQDNPRGFEKYIAR